MRRSALVGAVLALASAAVVSSAVAHEPSANGVPKCNASQLKIAIVGSFAGLGESGGYIGFTNRSNSLCSLSGWPTLIASRAGASMPATHVRTTQYGSTLKLKGVPDVTLHPGAMAEAVFVVGDNPGPGKTTCPPRYRHLRVTPPGNSDGVVLSAWIPYLDGYLPACSSVEVTMVVSLAAIHRK